MALFDFIENILTESFANLSYIYLVFGIFGVAIFSFVGFSLRKFKSFKGKGKGKQE